MASFVFEGKTVFYQLLGEGRPLLLLNGIMMQTRSWAPFLPGIQGAGLQPLLVDLLDQGQSQAMEGDYQIALQARMLLSLLDHLNIPQIDIFGTSYGGEVALQLAVLAPSRIGRMLLANTVAYTNAWLKEIGEAWILAKDNPEAYYATTIPVIYSPEFYDRRASWMAGRKRLLTTTAFASKDFQDRMTRLTRSAESHDVREQLHTITCPVLVIASAQDHITPPEMQEYLVSQLKNAELVLLPKTGHATFYERPDLFMALLIGFFNHREAVALP